MSPASHLAGIVACRVLTWLQANILCRMGASDHLLPCWELRYACSLRRRSCNRSLRWALRHRRATPALPGPHPDLDPYPETCHEIEVRWRCAGKDPRVETDFLPDKDREVEEAELRQKLAKEWELRQQVRPPLDYRPPLPSPRRPWIHVGTPPWLRRAPSHMMRTTWLHVHAQSHACQQCKVFNCI